jgi:hypothetical protein
MFILRSLLLTLPPPLQNPPNAPKK